MSLRLLLILSALFLHGCGTLAYTPQEWVIKEGDIPRIKVAGTVEIVNAQSSTNPEIVYSYGGTRMQTTYQAVTALMTEQARKELRKNGQPVGGGTPKKIELKVLELRSNYIAFFWKSYMVYQARLGNGQVIDKRVTHGSGQVHQDLNGCIAEGVIELFKDEDVKAYLAS